MIEGLSFQYPLWLSILCVALGLAYALGLYFRDKSFLEQSKKLNLILGAIRFTGVTLLSLLLLSPILKSLITETKKPVVVLAQDQSESIRSTMSAEKLEQYKQNFNNLKTSLSDKYDVVEYALGERVRDGIDFNFSDKITNLSQLMNQVNDLYSNQNLGAVILATDGIYNEGNNPLYTATKIGAPIYTIALGDTSRKKNLSIRRTFSNKIAYLGDKFTIQLDVAATNCAGAATNLSVYKIEGATSRKLQGQTISINKSDFFQTQEIILDADKAGIQHFRIALSEIAGEQTTQNNAKDIFIDVLDARQKILLLANSTHPDLSALKTAIENNKNYKVDIQLMSALSVKVSDYDFVILHQLPSKNADLSVIMRQLNEKKKSRWFIVGPQTNIAALNQMQSLLSISGAAGEQTNDIQVRINPAFSAFTFDEKVGKDLPNFAPLKAPFAQDFKEGGNAQVFLYQKIGKVDTKFPLMLVGEENAIRTGVLAAEGLWKWRLFDYLQHQNHDITNEVIGKTVQYLSIKDDKRKFRINTSKNLFNENEPIVFDGELYNDNFELINEADATLVISNEEGKEFPFTFNKTAKTYNLNAGQFPAGNYQYKAKVAYRGQELVFSGQFSIQPLQMESFESTADHAMLSLLSKQHGAEMVYPDNLQSIATKMDSDKGLKSIIFQTNKTRSIINIKWIFWILIALFSTEWFCRRYFGAY
ncbi:MAG: vWA domain-containing protein [Saprospiraceae bacterium]